MHRENFLPVSKFNGEHNFNWDAVGRRGKGKIIDVLTAQADIVVRSQAATCRAHCDLIAA